MGAPALLAPRLPHVLLAEAVLGARPHGRGAGPPDGHGRARHAPVLPRVLRNAGPARRALPAEADPARDSHDRRAAPRGGPEPVGARSRPLLPHPQGRAARERARALRRLDLRDPARPVAEPRRDAEGAVVGALSGLQDPPARRLGRAAHLVVHRRQRHPLRTRSTTRATVRSAAFPARGRRASTRRSVQAAGPAPTSWSAEFTKTRDWKGRHESAHLRARAPRVGDRSRRWLHPLVHGAFGLRQDDDRASRRSGDGPPRARGRVPRRGHRAHAPLEGPRLLEGGSRRPRRAPRLGRVAHHPPRRRRHRRRDLPVRAGARECPRSGRGARPVRGDPRRDVGRRVRPQGRERALRQGVCRRDQGVHRRRRPVRGTVVSRDRRRHRRHRARGVRRLRHREARGARARARQGDRACNSLLALPTPIG